MPHKQKNLPLKPGDLVLNKWNGGQLLVVSFDWCAAYDGMPISEDFVEISDVEYEYRAVFLFKGKLDEVFFNLEEWHQGGGFYEKIA